MPSLRVFSGGSKSAENDRMGRPGCVAVHVKGTLGVGDRGVCVS